MLRLMLMLMLLYLYLYLYLYPYLYLYLHLHWCATNRAPVSQLLWYMLRARKSAGGRHTPTRRRQDRPSAVAGLETNTSPDQLVAIGKCEARHRQDKPSAAV